MILEIEELEGRSLIDSTKIALFLKALSATQTKKETAKYIGISDRTMRDWVNRYKELNKYKTPRKSNSPYWDDGPQWHRKK